MNMQAFKENLGLEALPTELEKLIHFQTNVSGFERYSQGFGVLIDDKSGLGSWSEDPAFLDKLLPFAQASGSGSFYAIWNDGTDKPLNKMPVVVFGDEGGVHVVAENILQLLQLLTYDTEISVGDDKVYFYKDEADYVQSADLRGFLKCLKEDYGLDPIEDPAEIIDAAQAQYKEPFDNWFNQFYDLE